jgi:hypothetical protein
MNVNLLRYLTVLSKSGSVRFCLILTFSRNEVITSVTVQVDEEYKLLGCYAMYSAMSLRTFRRNLGKLPGCGNPYSIIYSGKLEMTECKINCAT